MDKQEKKSLLELIRWSPILIISLPFQLAHILIIMLIYGIPALFIWIGKSSRWMFNKKSWYEMRQEEEKKIIMNTEIEEKLKQEKNG